MKKLVSIIYIILLSSPVYAHIAGVKSLETFSTANPPKTLKVETVKDVTISKNIKIPAGNIIVGQIKIKPPKRFKRDATFTFTPSKYTCGEKCAYKVNKEFIGNYMKPINKKGVAKSAVLKIGDFVVPGVSIGYNLVNGAVKNEEGNVVKSAAAEVYENSPLSWFKKGSHIEIQKDNQFNLFFKPDRFNFKKYENDIEPINSENEMYDLN